MSSAEEATVNPDGSTSYEPPPVQDPSSSSTDGGFDQGSTNDVPPINEETIEEALKGGGIDPVVYLILFVLVLGGICYYYFIYRRKKEETDDFFSNLDVEKFNLKLPGEVDEYYQIKAKVEAAGWEPGKSAQDQSAQASGPHRVLAQALMKRAMADIPIVTHIQKEANGMNRLYSQSMVSVQQWRAYQAAEAMVSAEVEEVRAEADEIEPGWSQVIWRQAMQYHNALKQKHEAEMKAAEEQAKKRKEVEEKVMAAKKNIDDAKAKELAAQKAAEELIKEEERERQSKKAFSSGGGIKKGFLDTKGKKK